MMIQCDHCNVWQHGACVGIWGDEEAPDGECRCLQVSVRYPHLCRFSEYFCELCKPNLHAPLKRFLRQRQKQGFVNRFHVCLIAHSPSSPFQARLCSSHTIRSQALLLQLRPQQAIPVETLDRSLGDQGRIDESPSSRHYGRRSTIETQFRVTCRIVKKSQGESAFACRGFSKIGGSGTSCAERCQ